MPDGDGGWTEALTDVGDVSASIAPSTARALERITADASLSKATHIVTIRYREGVTTKSRIVFKDRLFDVVGVANPDERNTELVLLCEETVA